LSRDAVKLAGITITPTQDTVEDDLMRYVADANIALSLPCCCNEVDNVISAVVKWIGWIANDL